MTPIAPFPLSRPRRLRRTPWVRAMVAEARLAPADLIWPIFVREGRDLAEPVPSLPGVERLSIDRAVRAAEEAARLGIGCLALFPYVEAADKDPQATEAWNPENLVCRATRAIKAAVPEVGVLLDVALDPYNSDGHDGLVRDGVVLNDETLLALEKMALVQAEAGCDILGPSDMMDGRIGVIRRALEAHDFPDTLIMSYAAKYASCFYGPFRDAVGSGGALKGDKKTYQMDPANGDEALREVATDLAEGADMVMVKPGLPYLDICARVKAEFRVPDLRLPGLRRVRDARRRRGQRLARRRPRHPRDPARLPPRRLRRHPHLRRAARRGCSRRRQECGTCATLRAHFPEVRLGRLRSANDGISRPPAPRAPSPRPASAAPRSPRAAASSGIVREISGATAIRPLLISSRGPRLGERVDEGKAQLHLAEQQVERLDRHRLALRQHPEHHHPPAAPRQRRRLGHRLGDPGALERQVRTLRPDPRRLLAARRGLGGAERSAPAPAYPDAGSAASPPPPRAARAAPPAARSPRRR